MSFTTRAIFIKNVSLHDSCIRTTQGWHISHPVSHSENALLHSSDSDIYSDIVQISHDSNKALLVF